MTQRKPPGMSFESFAEAQINKARRDGLFDDLPGKGKPMTNLREAYDPSWWAKKLVQRENVSMLPPALQIRKTVEDELARIRELKSEARVRDAVAALNEQILHVNRSNVSGPPTTQAVLDIDDVVARWKADSL